MIVLSRLASSVGDDKNLNAISAKSEYLIFVVWMPVVFFYFLVINNVAFIDFVHAIIRFY